METSCVSFELCLDAMMEHAEKNAFKYLVLLETAGWNRDLCVDFRQICKNYIFSITLKGAKKSRAAQTVA